MKRIGSVAVLFLLLIGCGDQKALQGGKNETAEIISAVLAKQPDLVAQRKAFLMEHPQERSSLEGMIDSRLCVAPETAGLDDEFDKALVGRRGATPEGLSVFSHRWVASDRRFAINDIVKLPKHLRWKSAFSFCPNGTLYLGNPAIRAGRAHILIENKCSGHCSWGGRAILQRNKGRWRVEEEIVWWQA
ncbi:hypothetical protein KRZ98_11445 [Sphingobium sp. AS12]|uniref:hypothetical protein n=1 Tax=Sphingobium sp. AS12 TaxID=2849495 RepID=UPI001C3171C6|nr:hypothetical protein [Sphingobium sp. AS12]MBV2148900.1 hypothetical protein [Sphingobium sp. AS12]